MAKKGDEQNRGASFEDAQQNAQPPSGSKSWFLGIGINRYLHFPPLNNAIKDVQDVASLLQERYGLLAAYTRFLFDEEAERQNIIAQLDSLVELVEQEDRIIIYYSGHGHLHPKTGKGYWIPHDAEQNNTAQYIRNSTILGYIEDISSQHTLLVSDSCFSGSLFVRGGLRSTSAFAELEAIPSRWALCSGRHDEAVYDGRPGENSPFAGSILETLSTNTSPALNVGKLIDRVVEQTRANYRQLPEGNPLFGVGHKGGQYVFRLQETAGVSSALPKAKAKVLLPQPSQTSLFTDARDGKQYQVIEATGLAWFARDFAFESENSWPCEQLSENPLLAGRLYTWQEAQRVCPPGWRLPTDEEWKALAKKYGGYFDWESGQEKGQADDAYAKLMQVGTGRFNAQMGGYRLAEGVFYSSGSVGSYWTGTELNATQAWNYTFDQSSGKLYRFCNPKSHGRSCRYVKEL